jgi:hypothetical protein
MAMVFITVILSGTNKVAEAEAVLASEKFPAKTNPAPPPHHHHWRSRLALL